MGHGVSHSRPKRAAGAFGLKGLLSYRMSLDINQHLPAVYATVLRRCDQPLNQQRTKLNIRSKLAGQPVQWDEAISVGSAVSDFGKYSGQFLEIVRNHWQNSL